MIDENQFYQIKITIQRKLNEFLILLLNTVYIEIFFNFDYYMRCYYNF